MLVSHVLPKKLPNSEHFPHWRHLWTEGDQDWDIPGPVGGPVDGPVGGPLGEPPPGGGRGEGTLQDIK